MHKRFLREQTHLRLPLISFAYTFIYLLETSMAIFAMTAPLLAAKTGRRF